jgi:hypothetical protein
VDVFEAIRQTFMADQVQPGKEGFVWFHRNADYPFDWSGKAKRQGIPPESVPDLTTKRVFGGAAMVEGGMTEPVPTDVEWQFWNGKAWTGKTPARENLVIAIRLGGKLDANPQQWAAEAKALLDPAAR